MNFLKFLTIIFIVVFPISAKTQSREFPYSITNPSMHIKGFPSFYQIHPDAPSYMSEAESLRIGLSVNEGTLYEHEKWALSSENLFFVYPLPFIKTSIGGSAGILHLSSHTIGRFAFALGNALNHSFSFGILYSKLSAPTFSTLNGASNFTLSLKWKMTDNFSFVYRIESLFMSKIEGIPSDRLHKTELTLDLQKKYGFLSWLNLSLGERRLDFSTEIGIKTKILNGLFLYGGIAYRKLNREFVQNGITLTSDLPPSVEISTGISIYLDNLSVHTGYTSGIDSFSSTLVWDNKPVSKSIIPQSDYAYFINIKSNYNDKIHFKNILAYRHCLSDIKCKALIIKMNTDELAWIYAEEWSKLITKARKTGRYVIAYAYDLKNSSYAAIAGSTKIYMFSGGDLNLRGLSLHKIYFKELFDKIGVSAQFIKFGKFKSSPEMFTKHSPSKESYSQISKVLSDTEQFFFRMLLKRPNLTLKKIHSIFTNAVLDPQTALSKGLIDKIAYPDQIKFLIFKEVHSVLDFKTTDQINSSYFQTDKNGIALLLADGEIVTQKTNFSPFKSSKQIVAKEFVASLKFAAANPNIKLILIRINSPGGSALASEYLWRAVSKISHIKPIIISVGSLAASGGYYLSAPALKIFAPNTSIVGSIGIFGGKFSFKNLLAKVGIGIFTLKRSPYAGMQSPYKPYSNNEINLIRKAMKYHYNSFLNAVSYGRKLSKSYVNKIAQGRIFSGTKALHYKLVDNIGGLDDALRYSFEKSKLPFDARIYVVYPPQPSMFKTIIKKIIGNNIPLLNPLSYMMLPASLSEKGPWMRLMYDLKIK